MKGSLGGEGGMPWFLARRLFLLSPRRSSSSKERGRKSMMKRVGSGDGPSSRDMEEDIALIPSCCCSEQTPVGTGRSN
ncbi:unnamed protein product, partial [Musa banksii]